METELEKLRLAIKEAREHMLAVLNGMEAQIEALLPDPDPAPDYAPPDLETIRSWSRP